MSKDRTLRSRVRQTGWEKTPMKWFQKEITLSAHSRGFHIVTGEVTGWLPEIKNIRSGILHLFIKHTSASLTLNENADPSVREDFESHFSRAIPDGSTLYVHDTEGEDDMPAHLKASILGSSLAIPISNGRLNLGTWQGIYLCEHRAYGGSRTIVATLMGEEE